MKNFKAMATAVLAAMISLHATAGDILTFSYDTGAGTRAKWGTKKKENYDIAIHITDPNLVGKQITAVNVPVIDTEDMSGYKVWLSKELKLVTVDNVNQNAPDVTSIDVTPENGELSVTFDTPYTITVEGIYIGYSFNVDELTDETMTPLILSTEYNTEGFYMRTSRTYRFWNNRADQFYAVSPIEVTLSGVFTDNAVGISSLEDKITEKGDACTIVMTLANHGSNAVTSIDYAYDVAGLQGAEHMDLKEPIEAQYNKVGNVEIPIPAITEIGNNRLNMTITKVNGTDNEDLMATATARVEVLPFTPVHRPLLEEYTGTWCGWCPRGFVGLELMNEKYPDLFVGVSYHNGDPMDAIEYYPNNVSSFPDAWIDRVHETDAYHGDDMTSADFGIDKAYLQRAAVIAPASIEAKAGWCDEGKTKIGVVSTVTFAREMESGDYRVAYILVADDLHGSGNDWNQTNNFSKLSEYAGSEGLEPFVNGSSFVSGLHFNDVVVLAPDLMGVKGSLPSDITIDNAMLHAYNFTLADAVNLDGKQIIQDKSKVRVVVLLLNATTGEVLNANKTTVTDEDPTLGIDNVEQSEADVKSVTYYDMAGRRTTLPSNGLFIKSVTYKNGTVKTSKVVIK